MEFSPFSLWWLLKYSPDLNMKGWMFWFSICISTQSSKWMSCPSKKIIWLFKGDAPHMLDSCVMDFRHPYISIHPDCLWWTFQSSAMLNQISSEYSFDFSQWWVAWIIDHRLRSRQEMCNRMLLALQFSPSAFFHLEINFNYKWTCSTFCRDKPNFYQSYIPEWILFE